MLQKETATKISSLPYLCMLPLHQEESVFLQWIKDTDYEQLVKSLSKKRTRGLEICGRIALRTQLCKSSLDVILVLWLQLLA